MAALSPHHRRVFIRNLVLPSRIGVHADEHGREQRVRISVELHMADEPADPAALGDVVDYERLAEAIRAIVSGGHVKLVESLAHRIAGACLADARVMVARVEVEKLDVFEDAESAGVWIERGREVIHGGAEDGRDQRGIQRG